MFAGLKIPRDYFILGRENMNRKKLFYSMFTFAVMFVMLSVTTIVAEAAAPTNLRQISGEQHGIKVEWVAENTSTEVDGWYVQWSADGKNFYRVHDRTYPDAYSPWFTKNNLSAGSTYYIKVASCYEIDGKNVCGEYSAPIQVVTAPTASTSFLQTGAAPGKVTVSWNASAGATGYYIYKGDTKTTPVANVKGTTATIGAVTGSELPTLVVKPYKVSNTGFVAMGPYKSLSSVQCVPNKPGKVASSIAGNIKWKTLQGDNEVTVGWARSTNDEISADGWQVEIYSLANKKIKTYYVDGHYTYKKTFSLSKIKNKGFKVRVRGYIYIDNKRNYGNWSSKVTVIPAPGINVRNTSKKTAKKITWKKIANATKYEVYVCKNASGSVDISAFRKVATLKPNKTSYTYKKFKKGSYNGVFVKATVKVGKKKYKSTITDYGRFYVYSW